MGEASLGGTGVLSLFFTNVAYVALRLRSDVRQKDRLFTVPGIFALLAAIGSMAFIGFFWWLEYSDFSIGW